MPKRDPLEDKQPGDILMALSTSGNSHNIIDAIVTARSLGITVIGLTGETGGKIGRMSGSAIGSRVLGRSLRSYLAALAASAASVSRASVNPSPRPTAVGPTQLPGRNSHSSGVRRPSSRWRAVSILSVNCLCWF